MASSMDEWKMILATCALLVCIVWDIVLRIVKDYVKVPSWIPARLFVLNALTILIAGNVDIEKGNALSPSDQNYLEVLVHNQLKMDAARLTMCVFVGCILSGITIVQTEGGWSSLAALFVSLSFHVAIEIYALQNGRTKHKAGPWFVWSGAILSLRASSLLLLLGQVMLLCKVGRHFDFIGIFKTLSEDEENEGVGWEALRRQVMKSWFAVRVWKTGCYMYSSIFIPGALVIVTICVVAMAAKVGWHSSLLHQSKGGGNLTFYLQCIFILVGWILMLRRWLRPILYSYEDTRSKNLFFAIPILTLVPIAVLVKPLLLRLARRLLPFLENRKFTLRGILIFLSCAVVPLLLLCVLILPVTLLSSFCFVCCYFSNLVFKRSRESFLANAMNSKFRSMLDAFAPDKNVEDIFWELNKKSFDRINSNIDEVSKIEENCKGLLSIMGIVRLSESQQLWLHDRKKHSWMEAVSRIFKVIVDAKVGVLDMEYVLDAYRETKDVLMFVDCPDNVVVDPLNMFVTLNLERFVDSMECEVKLLFASFQEKAERVDGVLSRDQERGRVHKLVKELNDLGEKMFKTPLITRHDEECSHYNLEELGRMLRSLVGRVIVSSISEVPDVLVKYSKKWAENLDEEKIERGIELAGKVSALLERLVESGASASKSSDIEAAAGPAQ